MRVCITILALFAFAGGAAAQNAPDMESLAQSINERLGVPKTSAKSDLGWSALTGEGTESELLSLPQWGVAVKNRAGEIIDWFGQVEYAVSQGGELKLPGYTPPQGASLELIPASEYSALQKVSMNFGAALAPITEFPGAVAEAADVIASELCSSRGRPTEISLSLAVGAGGSIFVVEANTEASSQVTWNLPDDLCPNYSTDGETRGTRANPQGSSAMP